ncbi:MAG: creatininase family protein [Gemmatimonadetes bacterium]|nr:creatininase family protein [Gemmatimonadota bacterium]MDA1103934.1 creatininase family protein [Gemmatimonadota bacterium]
MAGRPYVLCEVPLKASRSVQYEVAVLPWGATEPHNLHLPFGTDSLQVEAVAIEASRLAWESNTKVVVLPTIALGANAQQLDTSMTLNLRPSTQAAILRDVVESLEYHGVPKLLVLNGHGGNDFRQMIRELQAEAAVFLCSSNWYGIADSRAFFEAPGDHAGELETSVMLHLVPELVLPLDEAGSGDANVFRVRGLRDGTAWAPRQWRHVTKDTGVGDPRAASAEKGRRFFEAVTRTLGDFLVDLASADLNDMYESGATGPDI